MRMCAWIGVSKSGYRHWRNRPDSATEERRVALKEHIAGIFAASRETYGYRRVRAELARQDVTCGPELVRHLMRALDLRACQPRPWRTTTIRDPDADPVADHVQRDFTAGEPGVKLVGDITYIKTWEGFCYLSTVIDCHTKAVIGWPIDDHMQTVVPGLLRREDVEAAGQAPGSARVDPDAHVPRPRPTSRDPRTPSSGTCSWTRPPRRSTWRTAVSTCPGSPRRIPAPWCMSHDHRVAPVVGRAEDVGAHDRAVCHRDRHVSVNPRSVPVFTAVLGHRLLSFMAFQIGV